MKRLRNVVLVLSAVLLTAGCALEKTENPLSPSVAAAIPGVSITSPVMVQPSNLAKIRADQQPVTLTIGNASSSGVRPLSYRFELASDDGFADIILSRDGVQPGENGQTSLKLSDTLAADRDYYWRARAEDGANTGPFSAVSRFSVFTPLELGAPVLITPINNVIVTSSRPTVRWQNAPRTGPQANIIYTVEASDSPTFVPSLTFDIEEQPDGQTRLQPPQDLPNNRQVFWRVRGWASNPETIGPWSETQVFRTPVSAPSSAPSAPANCTLPGPTPFDTLVCARSGYPSPMSPSNRGALLNQVAWLHRGAGWGMHFKPGGNRCPQPRTGIEISCDILVDGNGGVYDVLLDEEIPTFGYKGPINTRSNWVAPVAP